MKIAVASDVHLEFGDLDIQNPDGADVLILSGDILVARDITQRDPYLTLGLEYRSNRYHDFMQRCSEKFGHVIYILGNHEHYNYDFAKTYNHLKEVFGYLKNVHVLEKSSVDIDGVTFIGGTLWTDMNKRDPLTLYKIRSYMNDFRIITDSDRPVNFKDSEGKFHTRTGNLLPETTVDEFHAMVEFIRQTVAANPTGTFVVAGHHAPSKLSTKPQYADDWMVNGAYSSSLDSFMQDHPQIKLWTHGHTHHEFDYMVGSCRVFCNPRGYVGHEEQASLWQIKSVTI